MKQPWTSLDDVITKLRRRWHRGTYLSAHLRGEKFERIIVPIRSPKASDLVEDLQGSLGWIRVFDETNRTGTDGQLFEVEQKVRRNRFLGDNPVPVKVRIDSFEQLCRVLGTSAQVHRAEQLLEATGRMEPALRTWVQDRPMVALANEAAWEPILTTVRWIVDHDVSNVDLRHLDAPGIDTKFVERHRKVLRLLLDTLLPAGSVDRTSRTFSGRYGFRSRPTYVRFRLLSPVPQFPSSITELELRTDELARLELPVSTVFVVENRATYLAFPELLDAIVVFGGGYAVTAVEPITWFANRQIVYWGDIDTHGFAILARLRRIFPHVRSILMDSATLLAYRDQWVVEPTPANADTEALTPSERALYKQLVDNIHGKSVRLEQERVSFSRVNETLSRWRK